MLAITHEDFNLLKSTIEGGEEFDNLFNDETPLHWAALYGTPEMVTYLIAQGYKVNAQTHYFRETPLHLAIQQNRKEIVELLLENGADPNIRNYDGENTVYCAIRWSEVDVCKALLDKGANPNIYNKIALSPLHVCVDLEKNDFLRLLLRNKADPDYQNSQGQTPFHVAVERGLEQLAASFATGGADPEVRDAELITVWNLNSAEFKDRCIPPEVPESILEKSSSNKSYASDELAWLKKGLCFFCQKFAADRIVLPCRHKVICHSCAPSFFEEHGECPQCEVAIWAAIKE